jgi:hypothetical protein
MAATWLPRPDVVDQLACLNPASELDGLTDSTILEPYTS